MSFQNPDGSFENENGRPPVTLAQPATGSTLQVGSATTKLFVNPPANLAALTIQLPRSPEKFYELDIGYGVAITALSFIDATGAAVPVMPTAGAAGTSNVLRYLPGFPNQAGPWVKWR